MTYDELRAIFERDDDEFLKFDRVEPKLSKRADIHAFIMLDSLVPDTGDMVAGAAHDEIWLAGDLEELAKVITEAQAVELVRCGVRYDRSTDSLAMFV